MTVTGITPSEGDGAYDHIPGLSHVLGMAAPCGPGTAERWWGLAWRKAPTTGGQEE